MYKPIPNGTTEQVYGYTAHIPPVGFGINRITGKLEPTDILKRSDVKEEQYWEATFYPPKYKQRLAKEEELQKTDKDYYDPELEDFREQEWGRRLRGVWFWNKGKLVYITGLHYLFLNWWGIDVGLPEFFDYQRKIFYLVDLSIEDEKAYGLLLVMLRRGGKTYIIGVFVYEFISRVKKARGGLVSKTDKDAKNEVFKKAIVSPYKTLPHFFKPTMDTGKGSNPESELRFGMPSKRGAGADKVYDDEEMQELDSFIDFAASGEHGYDGPKLRRYGCDEPGKPGNRFDPYRRWQVAKKCLWDNRKGIIGKALLATTVDEINDKDKKFQQLFKDSDPTKRLSNGQTISGLLAVFVPATEARCLDKYGYADTEKAYQEIMAEREAYKNDPEKLAEAIRKDPITIEEAFRSTTRDCLFDMTKIHEQLDFLSWNENITERGNFVWENGVKDSKVVWEKNSNGRWLIPKGFILKPEETNMIEKRSNLFFPLNNWRFGSACDPYRANRTEDHRRSMGTSIVKQKNNLTNHEDFFIEAYVSQYYARPNTAEMMYEDMLLQSVYFGCSILIENNVGNGPFDYFRRRGYGPFLMHLPGYKEPGVPSSVPNKQTAFYFMESMIDRNSKKILFPLLLEDLLEFQIDDTKKFDLSMAALWTELACSNVKYASASNNSMTKKITDYFPKRKTA